MAVDKNLPNDPDHDRVKLDIEPNEREVELKEEETTKGPIEINPTEDGGVEVDFDPDAIIGEGGQNHEANLAEYIDDNILGEVSSELLSDFESYKASRDDWEQAYIKGLDLLGFKYENRTEPFQGASGATHPVLAEAVTQFQASAYKELLPAGGPVRTQIVGLTDEMKEAQAERVKEFMNYQIMVEMREYEPEFDQMLFDLPLAGSTFKKVYYDQTLMRCVSKFVPAEDLVVPYSATSLEDADSIMHIIKMSSNDLRKQQVSEFYRDIDIGESSYEADDVEDKKAELDGASVNNRDEVHTIIECHVDLDLHGFEDKDEEGELTGIKLPYIVTIMEGSGDILAIRRNYNPQDPTRKRKNYFVHFKFLPGLGFYGFGLIHMIGGLSRTATTALRQLLDAGTLANLPAGFKQRGIRVRDEAQPLQPGEFRDVDAPGGDLNAAFMMLPFKGPNATLLQLMGTVVQAGQRFASIADMQVGDGNQSAAVGTTVALLERGSRVMSAIHKRCYSAMRSEFMLMAEAFATYLPPVYPYNVIGGQRQIKQMDFSPEIDVVPVADPNIFSQTQRIAMAQTTMQMAQANPAMHNMYEVYRDLYEALGVKNIDSILKRPAQPTPMDPAMENITVLGGGQIKAFPGQDHRAHMDAHLTFMATKTVRNNPVVIAALQKNIMEHIALMAQEQIEMEFKEELMQLQQLQMQMAPIQQQMAMNPQALQQNPQVMQMQQQMQNLTQAIESRKATLIAETLAEYQAEEEKLFNEVGDDPLIKLKSREVDLKAKEEMRKEEEGKQKANMDKLRLIQNRKIAEDKLEQDDDHAKLRASVSLAKDGIKQMKATVLEGE
jgi:hypothetical protein